MILMNTILSLSSIIFKLEIIIAFIIKRKKKLKATF